MINRFKKIIFLLAFIGLAIPLNACQQKARKRPFGYVKLGKIEELKRPESFISEHSLVLRYDQRGFSAMSILCTYDLAVLKVQAPDAQTQGEKQILVSPYSQSTYNLDGSVLTGPAIFPLPYFELVAAPGEYNGPVDTLFAKIGVEKPAEWRLKVDP